MTDAPTPRDVIRAEFAGGIYNADTIAFADGILTALTSAGYVVVPREPTTAMVQAAAQLDFSAQDDPTWPEFYRAMIAEGEKK